MEWRQVLLDLLVSAVLIYVATLYPGEQTGRQLLMVGALACLASNIVWAWRKWRLTPV